MLRKLCLAMAAACAFALGGCATNGAGPSAPSLDPAVIAQVQQTASTVCGFLPTVETVAQIIASFTSAGPVVGVVSQAANGICAAVTAKGVRLGQKAPKYRGVAIRGQFVR